MLSIYGDSPQIKKLVILKNNLTAVKLEKLPFSSSITVRIFALLGLFWQAAQTQFKRKSKFRHQCHHLYHFIPYIVTSWCTFYMNLQITLRWKRVNCFVMLADKPPVARVDSIQMWHSEVVLCVLFLPGWRSFAATTRRPSSNIFNHYDKFLTVFGDTLVFS